MGGRADFLVYLIFDASTNPLARLSTNGLHSLFKNTPRDLRVLKKLLPKQENFFALFQQAAHQLVGAAEQFVHLVTDLAHADNYAQAIAEHESTADNWALASFDLLHKTFITPFDRHDIHQLTRKLDDTLDVINRTAQRITLYQIQVLPTQFAEIAQLVLSSSIAVRSALKQLEHLKNATTIINLCRSIGEHDSKAEHIMLQGVGKLFAEESDFKRLLILKEIYEYSTQIISECHDVADIIKGIVLEYS